MNATYIISIARKLGCSIFLLPEDLIEVIIHLLNMHEWFDAFCLCGDSETCDAFSF